MNTEQQKELARAIAGEAVNALNEQKGLDVTCLAVADKTVLADEFVLATGTSNTHVRALADEVEFKLGEKLGVTPTHTEGASGNAWILMDYGCVVVNIFTRAARDFYKLERRWSDTHAKENDTEGSEQQDETRL